MSLTEPVRSVLIIIAMEQEARPLVQRLRLKSIEDAGFLPGAPFVAWGGEVCGLTVRVVWCGRDRRFGGVNNVATTAASVCTYASIAAFGAPQLLISAGTAGGFQVSGAAVGDVFLSTKCVFHSRRIPSDEGSSNFEEYGFGHYRSPPLSRLAASAGLKTGVVSTSDSLDSTAQDLELMRSEGAAVKEMEAAAVAWVCQQLSVPFVAIKAITDIVDGSLATRGEFEENLHMASDALQQRTEAVLTLLANTPLRQWAATTAPALLAMDAVSDRGGGTADRARAKDGSAPSAGMGGSGLWTLAAVMLGVALVRSAAAAR